MRKNNKDDSIRIIGVPNIINQKSFNIAKNKGISRNRLIKILLQKIINECPEYLKTKSEKKKTNEINITGVSQKTIQELKTITENSGINLSCYLKKELIELIKSEPKNMSEKTNLDY